MVTCAAVPMSYAPISARPTSRGARADHTAAVALELAQCRAARSRITSITEVTMLHYAAVFLVIALVAALFGFGGIAVGAVEIAKILFFIFLVLFVASLVWGILNKRNP
jgi:uncharacterized membrane protein YtjA (UPF0391 family)